jgi:DNA-binding PadR family transcriptional regulator
MTFRAPTYVVLGMLRLGVKSGYAIKKVADASTQFILPTSLAQVYPELARLEREGLVTRREDPNGSRKRSAYQLTDEGRAALLRWLRSTRVPPFQFRDEGMLRLYFADSLPREDQIALIRRLRERARDAKTHLRRDILPSAESQSPAEVRFPVIAGRMGADTYAYWERWLARLEAEMGKEAASGHNPPGSGA